jgi:hypothetical protein
MTPAEIVAPADGMDTTRVGKPETATRRRNRALEHERGKGWSAGALDWKTPALCR